MGLFSELKEGRIEDLIEGEERSLLATKNLSKHVEICLGLNFLFAMYISLVVEECQ
jgi:hypothetical protein